MKKLIVIVLVLFGLFMATYIGFSKYADSIIDGVKTEEVNYTKSSLNVDDGAYNGLQNAKQVQSTSKVQETAKVQVTAKVQTTGKVQ